MSVLYLVLVLWFSLQSSFLCKIICHSDHRPYKTLALALLSLYYMSDEIINNKNNNENNNEEMHESHLKL